MLMLAARFMIVALIAGQTAPDDLSKSSEAELLVRLGTDRVAVKAELTRRGPTARPGIIAYLVDDANPIATREAAANFLAEKWDADIAKTSLDLLTDLHADVRATAVMLLGQHGNKDDALHTALVPLIDDTDARVRAITFFALGRIARPTAAEVLANALRSRRVGDVRVIAGALDRLGKVGVNQLIAMAESGSQLDLDLVVAAFGHLRERPAYESLYRLLKNPHLSIPQRAAVVGYYANFRLSPPVPMTPLLDYANEFPDDAREVELAILSALARGRFAVDPRLETYLRGSLEEADAGTRASALDATGRYHPAGLAGHVRKLLVEGPVEVRGRALIALRAYSRDEFAATAKRWLTGQDARFVKLAMSALVADAGDAKIIVEEWNAGRIQPANRVDVKAQFTVGASKNGELLPLLAQLKR